MAEPGEDVQELRFMLQHYKEECGRNGREIQQLRDENVQLKARVAYLLQKVDKQSELLKQLPTVSSESGPSSSGTLPVPSPVVPPSNGPSKRKSPPVSPERKHIPDLMLSPTSPSKDKGKQPALKRRKCDVFVLIPPDRRHPVKAPPTPAKVGMKLAPSSPSNPRFDDPWDYSSDSSLTSLSDDDDDDLRPPSRRADASRARTASKGPSRAAQRPRSPDRELTYVDPSLPIPIELDDVDGGDPTYVPSRPTSPVRRPSKKRASRTNSSKKAEEPKPPTLSAPVRSATIAGKSESSPTRAEAGPSSPRQPPAAPRHQRRVTLHLSPPSPSSASAPHDHLAGLTRFAAHPSNAALLQSTLSRKRFSEVLGGNTMRMCVPLGARNFLFPTLKQNPRLPSAPGLPGLLFRANVEAEWRGDVQTVFVGVRGAEYRYVGEYRLMRGERLGVEEYRALAAPMRRKWANGIAKKSKFKDIRVRIRTRREHDREATAEEIAVAVADKDDKCEVSEEDVLQAYQSGQERLLVWRMQCVGFDEAFLADLVSKL
uniref:Cytochrome P450 monooxygenase BOT1 (Calcineurin-dependent protein 5)) n=1 Tax=Ganoderma boninense TaxID=34458 RepID=A0A5K1K0Z3_9APHY|nr:Cytochrome P450 monooxygenase BOT1 (EC (Botrydial biosynthesis cluster protein 1) (Calcineurin-dependent protein 5) [Ganoderma boninense]